MRLFSLISWILATLCAATPAMASTSLEPPWGVLGEMVEKDFAVARSSQLGAVTVRWEVPNERLVISIWWSNDWSEISRYALEPSTGRLIFTYPRMVPEPIYLQPDGQLHFDPGAGSILTGPSRNLWWDAARNAYSFRPMGGYVLDFTPTAGKAVVEARIASLIASGKVRRAGGQDGASASAQIQVASPLEDASISSPASPHAGPAAAPVVIPVNGATMTGPRYALVIGNSAYAPSMGQLPNPANDAAAMTKALANQGFQVTLVKNADQKTMRRSISEFGRRLAKAGPGTTGLFFYAGHGIQAKGINYLIPIDANIQTQADVEMESVGADAVLEQMEEAGASTNIVILDACRNMPLVRGFRSPTRGLAPMDAPNGSFIAYSTAPGSVAADGLGANSPFVTALIKNLSRKGESIEAIFRDVRREVVTTTEGMQTPWDSSSLMQPFYFAGR